MNRLPDWPERFHAYIDSIKETPFEWETSNCAHRCAGVVQAITGKDLMRGYRSAKTTRGFFKLMQDKGFENLSDLVESMLPKIHISQAKVGDIAAIKSDDQFGYSLGVVNGEMILTFYDKGMGLIPLFDAEHAFEV